ncbi:MAG TPA: SH3 domain-containing protein [Acetobacteraceae bacterium]|nr:SH3 domain-containing protein [Acetobacteraceae bacterium]
MRCFAPASIPARLLLMSMLALTPAQGRAQSGMLQLPAHRPPESAPAKPAAAPRAPVRQIRADHATPILRPRGPVHPARPPEERQPHRPLPLPLPPPLPSAATPATVPATAPAHPAPARRIEPEKPTGTGLPLPRFAALRTDDVNLRAGPGFRYPIEWIYKRRDLPMEIEREFEVWRLVKDPDGILGWVHEATLTGRRTFMVQGSDATLRAEPKDDAAPVAVLKIGVIGRIRSCKAGSDWCRMQVGNYRGFLKRSQFWGALPEEAIGP